MTVYSSFCWIIKHNECDEKVFFITIDVLYDFANHVLIIHNVFDQLLLSDYTVYRIMDRDFNFFSTPCHVKVDLNEAFIIVYRIRYRYIVFYTCFTIF